MGYEKPTMYLLRLCSDDVIRTSEIELDPDKLFPEIWEDGEDWET